MQTCSTMRLRMPLASTRRIPNDFFASLVRKATGAVAQAHGRTVFVLDEYESLFERMRFAMKANLGVRYTVVQPLLNQMVAFSLENLLVFIGQRPDAYCVIMDQNQLSPYVQQDLFPLFEHREGALLSEFNSLLQKVLTDRVTFESSFADAVFAETAGHPFLTVNLLVHLFEWLIDMKRPASSLKLSAGDFQNFAGSCLTTEVIGTRPEYNFFLKVAGEALSADGKQQSPWLHAVYLVLRRVAEGDPATMRCSRDRFNRIVAELNLAHEFGYHPDELIRTASLSNFLLIKDNRIGPRIPLMARIAMATRPTISW